MFRLARLPVRYRYGGIGGVSPTRSILPSFVSAPPSSTTLPSLRRYSSDQPTEGQPIDELVDSYRAEEGKPSLPDSIPGSIRQTLAESGIDRLYPIQEATYAHITKGQSLIAKAHTGTGKTLAFLIPIAEHVIRSRRSKYPKKGDAPSALVVCPTRELAIQVSNEMERVSSTVRTVRIHGGVGYTAQLRSLKRGVDLVVGTPGRIVDLLRKGNLDFSHVRTLVLDESDHMLDIGFKDEVEEIFSTVKVHRGGNPASSERGLQTLLFSATCPPWVQGIKSKYLGEDCAEIDLVGDKSEQGNKDITYLAVPCAERNAAAIVSNILRVYAPNSQALIFMERKSDADQLANDLYAASMNAAALHGDIAQNNRDRITNDFRSKKIDYLVATDVAARGIDIPGVDLVIQSSIPGKVETFLHRSGRTGRAGRKGTNVILFDPSSQQKDLRHIELKTKIDFSKVPAPSYETILEIALKDTMLRVSNTDEDQIYPFKSFASRILEQLSPEDAVSTLLAMSAENVNIKSRSLMTGDANMRTFGVQYTGKGKAPLKKGDIQRELKSRGKLGNKELTVYQAHEDKKFIVDLPETHASIFAEFIESNNDLESFEVLNVPRLSAMPLTKEVKRNRKEAKRENNRQLREDARSSGGGYRRSHGQWSEENRRGRSGEYPRERQHHGGDRSDANRKAPWMQRGSSRGKR